MEIYEYTCVVGEKTREKKRKKKERKNNIKIRNNKWYNIFTKNLNDILLLANTDE